MSKPPTGTAADPTRPLSLRLHELAESAPAEAFARLVSEPGLDAPLPGHGLTRARFAILALLGSFELSVARLVEGHLDALAILAEAEHEPPEGRLGVWAAGPINELQAERIRDGWRLNGVRRWCSGAPTLTHAIVRAATGSEEERLFLVALDDDGVQVIDGSWPALGMAGSATFDVRFVNVRLQAGAEIGAPGFYLERRGFWMGGAGVAAVWLGGAKAIAQLLCERAGDDPHRLAHLGWVTSRLAALDALAVCVADAIDAGDRSPIAIEGMARMLRAEVAESASLILERTGRATGAGPLAHDRKHAQRVADLELYIRQSHAEADLEAIGRLRTRGALNHEEC